MKKQKSFTKTSILVSLTFYLSGCTVIGNTNLPTFKPVDDCENVIAFYKENDDNYSNYYDNSQCILFFNTKTEKITHKWDFNEAIEENVCGMTSFFNTKIVENEIFIFQNNRTYHIKKETGEPFFILGGDYLDISPFVNKTVLITNYDSNYIYDTKNGSLKKTDSNLIFSNSFEIDGKFFYTYYRDIYSYENGNKVYRIESSDIDFINNSNFYTAKESVETEENIINTETLNEVVIDDNGDFANITVTNLKMNRDILTVIKDSDTQIVLFETDSNYYLYATVYTKENGLWSQGIEKITKDDKIKISTTWDEYYNSYWIEEQNGAYWIKDSNDSIMKINKNNFKAEVIKL